MKYRLNKLPVKTTNNFKVNDIELDIDIPDINNFNDFLISNDTQLIVEKNIVKKSLSTKIGLDFSKYLELNIKVPKNIKIDKPVILEYEFKDKE